MKMFFSPANTKKERANDQCEHLINYLQNQIFDVTYNVPTYVSLHFQYKFVQKDPPFTTTIFILNAKIS